MNLTHGFYTKQYFLLNSLVNEINKYKIFYYEYLIKNISAEYWFG